MKQPGFSDVDERLARLSGLGDQLEAFSRTVDFEAFRPDLEKAFSVRFGRMTERAGLTNLTFHDLRHEATSRFARYLVNPLDLMRVTGHRDLKSLDRYYQPIMHELADKIEANEPTPLE